MTATTATRRDLEVRLDPSPDRFAGIGPDQLTDIEQGSVIALALGVLAGRVADGPLIAGETDTRDYMRLSHGDHDREVFGCLFLTARNRLIADEELFMGSVDRAAVYPRVIVQRALAHNAAAIVCYHNHPSSTAEPSPADEHITHRIKTVLEELDISLLDHLVVSRTGTVSMAARGLI